jgi:predicted transcriptional regulator
LESQELQQMKKQTKALQEAAAHMHKLTDAFITLSRNIDTLIRLIKDQEDKKVEESSS